MPPFVIRRHFRFHLYQFTRCVIFYNMNVQKLLKRSDIPAILSLAEYFDTHCWNVGDHLSIITNSKASGFISSGHGEFGVFHHFNSILPKTPECYFSDVKILKPGKGLNPEDTVIMYNNRRINVEHKECVKLRFGELKLKNKFAKEHYGKPAPDDKFLDVRNHKARGVTNVEKAASDLVGVSSEVKNLHKDKYHITQESCYEWAFTHIWPAFTNGEWNDLTKQEIQFLQQIGVFTRKDFYSRMYYTHVEPLSSNANRRICRAVKKKKICDGSCGFLQSPALIVFRGNSPEPAAPWKLVNEYVLSNIFNHYEESQHPSTPTSFS